MTKHLRICAPCQRGLHGLCTGDIIPWDHPDPDLCVCTHEDR